MTMLLALYTAGGGVLVRGGSAGTPRGNTAMLALGIVDGSVMGTTGASMVLITSAAARQRPPAAQGASGAVPDRAGGECLGALTPLGNPPLYIGLLHGVPFFWPVRTCSARCCW